MKMAVSKKRALVLWFDEVGIKDVPFVGGKNASLGEMHRELTKKGVRIPDGFATTSFAYFDFIEKAGIKREVQQILKGLNVRNYGQLAEAGSKIRRLILNAEFPEKLKNEILKHYAKLSRKYGMENADVAVRSSATAEDLPSITASSHVLVKINGKAVYDTIENIYANFSQTNTSIEVAAMEGGEVVWKEAQQVYQHPAKALLCKITTETGREIELTKDHSLITLDQETLAPKVVSVRDLQENEFVPVTRAVPLIETTGNAIDVLEYINGRDIYVENDRIYVKNNSSNWRIQHPLPRHIPMDEDFAYFLGIYCAEGCTYRGNEIIITNSDQSIIERAKRFFKPLNIPTEQKINRHSLRVYCKGLVRLLHALTGKPLETKGKGKSCSIKRVPNLIFGCSPTLICSFLSGCIDGDGYISKHAIEYCSTSKLLTGGVIKLLELLNIPFYLRQKGNACIVFVPSAHAETLSRKLSLSPRRMAKLQKLIQEYERKEAHPEFKNVLSISPALSKRLKEAADKNLPKEAVQTAFCPACNKQVEQTSYYKQQKRYFCQSCHKTFYDKDVPRGSVLKYRYYDEQGRFTEGMSPWNKGIVSGRASQQQFAMLMAENSVSQYSDFFNKSVLWDRIKQVEAFPYNGMVYDFTVPGVENFAAGIGGIITHNSSSFAGQQESYLNVRGESNLLEACRKCIASLFTNRAIAYRQERGFSHFKVALSIGIQKMVRSDRAGSGVMFTIDTESGFDKVILIDAGYGLGENIVKGRINPDEYYVFKTTLGKNLDPIISRKLGSKQIKMVYAGSKVKNVATSAAERSMYVLNDVEILTLAKWGRIIEEHYSAKHRKYMPMDIEWAKDGISGKLFIVQARPETVQSRRDVAKLERYVLKERGRVLAVGSSVGSKIGSGKAHLIKSVAHIKEFKPGEVLVTEMTDPDWVPIMKMASAIVTDRGGKSCHAAIVSREMGIPCIVGTNNATKVVRKGQDVTVSCADGEEGKMYDGKLRFEVKKIDLKSLPKTKTRIMVNIGNPDEAFAECFLPVAGVGLAREEFITNNYIGIHPMAILNFDKLKDRKAKEKIAELTRNYKDKKQFYIDKLSEGIATIAAAFYPREVIVRLSDFKSNEYANLIGGREFEPVEDNPMLGWRGASRYYDAKFKAAFALECKAFVKARGRMGLDNIKIMVPMCRTIDEGKKVIAEMMRNGLVQGKDGLEIYVMCEIPSNVILAEEFAKVFDGFSIGSNDLTQLTLGVDRDSELVASIFNERDDAVKWMVAHVIKAAKKSKRKIGICGQAPSDYEDFAEFLVDEGIDSMSLNPDAVVKTLLLVAKRERRKKV